MGETTMDGNRNNQLLQQNKIKVMIKTANYIHNLQKNSNQQILTNNQSTVLANNKQEGQNLGNVTN